MAKDSKFVDQTPEQKDPYKAKGSDFSVQAVKAANAQSGHGKGFSEGDGLLLKQSENQESPRANESASVDGPSEWGKGGKGFSVGKNDEGGTSVSNYCGVDLDSGGVTCKGHKKTKAGEVSDPNLSLG